MDVTLQHQFQAKYRAVLAPIYLFGTHESASAWGRLPSRCIELRKIEAERGIPLTAKALAQPRALFPSFGHKKRVGDASRDHSRQVGRGDETGGRGMPPRMTLPSFPPLDGLDPN
jgi:hypothetical protein